MGGINASIGLECGGATMSEPNSEAERFEYDIRCTECGWDVPIPEAVLNDFERKVLRKLIDRVLDRMYEIRGSDDE
jgi:hypothetical protein